MRALPLILVIVVYGYLLFNWVFMVYQETKDWKQSKAIRERIEKRVQANTPLPRVADTQALITARATEAEHAQKLLLLWAVLLILPLWPVLVVGALLVKLLKFLGTVFKSTRVPDEQEDEHQAFKS